MLDVRALRDHLTDHESAGPFCMGDGPCPIGTMQDAERVVRALLDMPPPADGPAMWARINAESRTEPRRRRIDEELGRWRRVQRLLNAAIGRRRGDRGQ